MAAECLYRTVDAIWYAAGDTATDFNFYTKRGLLAAVYSSTLLYWLDDTSEDSAKTWAFLDRRIAEVMKVPRMLSELGDRIGRIVGDLPGPWRRFRRAMNR
jgi:ubiquinone biosynthesis protein COQ9